MEIKNEKSKLFSYGRPTASDEWCKSSTGGDHVEDLKVLTDSEL